MKKSRMFIAVELEDDLRKQLSEVQKTLATSQANVKWVEPHNIHLTIKFLGDVDPALIVGICKVIESATEKQVPFVVPVIGVGTFPPTGLPRIIWVGASDEELRLSKIYNTLNSGLVPLGIPFEKRKFNPHITLGRIRTPKGADALKKMVSQYSQKPFGSIAVDSLTLFSSELTEKGPLYTPLANIRLCSSGS
ncbi:MAG: RNA 2',3'-cyclic phosphodiesterase [Planctomycetota bacterium]|nr:RNA 2',3'-cyclic phosphodiesterase [Planctomycetota bacterium]